MQDLKSYPRGICTSMFPIALFTVVRKWNKPRCPEIGKKNEENVTHVHKFCSTIKKNEICGNLDGIGNYCSMTEAHREKISLLCLLCRPQVFICIYECALICTWGYGSYDQKWHPKKEALRKRRKKVTEYM